MHNLMATIDRGGEPLSEEVFIGRLHKMFAWNFPSLEALQHKYLGWRLILCGSGPSLTDPWTLSEIRKLHKKRHTLLMAPNMAHDTLAKHGIIPDFGVVIDHGSHCAGYIKKFYPNTKYIIGHQAAPETFQAWAAHTKPYTVVVASIGYDEVGIMRREYPGRPWARAGGKSTVGLRALPMAEIMGFREFDLFAFDSCYRGDPRIGPETGRLHAMEKPIVDQREIIEVMFESRDLKYARSFVTNRNMGRQLYEFQETVEESEMLARTGRQAHLKIRVHGDGAIPFIAAIMGYDKGNADMYHPNGAALLQATGLGPRPVLTPPEPSAITTSVPADVLEDLKARLGPGDAA